MPLPDQLALTFVPGIGDVLAKNLISYCGSAEDIFKTSRHK
ncbi:MAG: DNA-protecting protein DprA, partial [Sphingobacteriaceae bacterium]